ncbi:MAG: hypothetical protein CMN77_17665, partial [Spirochaetaceae bacterium]|nr:hypothetical protein [Spirochaetaceae bacterium]
GKKKAGATHFYNKESFCRFTVNLIQSRWFPVNHRNVFFSLVHRKHGRFGAPAIRPVLISILISLLLSHCARFRIDELSPSTLYSIPLQMNVTAEEFPEGLPVLRTERIYGNFPYMPSINDDGIFLSDVSYRVVRFFPGSQASPTWILNARGKPLEMEIETTPIPSGIPGSVASNDEALYIEIHEIQDEKKKTYSPIDSNPDLPPENRLPAILRPEYSTSAPARIVRVDLDERTVTTLKDPESANATFDQIHRLVMGEDDTLYVFHRKDGAPAITIYREGVLLGSEQPKGITAPDELKNHRLEIERMIPYPGGERFLISAVFRNPSTFAPEVRKIYHQDRNGEAREIYSTDETKDALSWAGPDGGFILETLDDSGGILFKIFSAQGEYLNNQLLRFPGVRESWRETYRNLNNRIFSVRINEGNYQLNEWQ